GAGRGLAAGRRTFAAAVSQTCAPFADRLAPWARCPTGKSRDRGWRLRHGAGSPRSFAARSSATRREGSRRPAWSEPSPLGAVFSGQASRLPIVRVRTVAAATAASVGLTALAAWIFEWSFEKAAFLAPVIVAAAGAAAGV